MNDPLVMVVSLCPALREKLLSHASPCTHHVSSSLPAYIDLILFPYCFRIVSASGSENDRRTIGERYGIDTGSIRDQYGIDTRPIRDRYENDTRTVFSDSHPKRLIRNLTFSSSFLLIIFYILTTRRALQFMWLMTSLQIAMAQPLYKNSLPSSQVQAD